MGCKASWQTEFALRAAAAAVFIERKDRVREISSLTCIGLWKGRLAEIPYIDMIMGLRQQPAAA